MLQSSVDTLFAANDFSQIFSVIQPSRVGTFFVPTRINAE